MIFIYNVAIFYLKIMIESHTWIVYKTNRKVARILQQVTHLFIYKQTFLDVRCYKVDITKIEIGITFAVSASPPIMACAFESLVIHHYAFAIVLAWVRSAQVFYALIALFICLYAMASEAARIRRAQIDSYELTVTLKILGHIRRF